MILLLLTIMVVPTNTVKSGIRIIATSIIIVLTLIVSFKFKLLIKAIQNTRGMAMSKSQILTVFGICQYIFAACLYVLLLSLVIG